MPGQWSQTSTTPSQYSLWFVLIVAIFITCLLTANITAVKLVQVFGLIVPAGLVVFPLSYIIGNVLTAVTPLTYVVVAFLKRHEGIDVYDYDTRFNPLLVGES